MWRQRQVIAALVIGGDPCECSHSDILIHSGKSSKCSKALLIVSASRTKPLLFKVTNISLGDIFRQ